MGSNRCPGLRLRGGVHWIDINSKRYGRIYESTGASEQQRELAEQFYFKRLAQAFEERRLGVTRARTFNEAGDKHLAEERGVLKSLEVDEWALGWARPHIGQLTLEKIHDGTLAPLKLAMGLKGCKSKTINLVLQVVRKILNKAARRWRDDNTGKTWLATAPLIELLQVKDARPPYPLSWDEERKVLLPQCPPHIEDQVLFYVNAGAREQELCALKWSWERKVPGLGTLFMLPEAYNKNGQERVIVLNSVSQAVVERQRGRHPEFVFTYLRRGKNAAHRPITGTNNTAWLGARARAAKSYREVLGADCPAGFRTLHVHDLRHTFGRRLRAAGVSKEIRSVLLGHSSGDITTHYSAGELGELFDAVKKIEVPIGSAPTLTVLRTQAA
jgi:integrase